MFEERKEQSLLDIKFKGKEGDSLSSESADEFHEIVENWERFEDSIKQLNRWCEYYCGKKYVPINFALKLWEEVEHTDELWSFVEEEFKNYKDVLDQHGSSLETVEDIKKRLADE